MDTSLRLFSATLDDLDRLQQHILQNVGRPSAEEIAAGLRHITATLRGLLPSPEELARELAYEADERVGDVISLPPLDSVLPSGTDEGGAADGEGEGDAGADGGRPGEPVDVG